MHHSPFLLGACKQDKIALRFKPSALFKAALYDWFLKHAGAELGQALFQMELWFTLIKEIS